MASHRRMAENADAAPRNPLLNPPPKKSILRLRKKHDAGGRRPAPPPDPEKLLAAQSVSNALIAGIAVLVLMIAVWTWLAVVSGRVFPWFSVAQGLALGIAVRRYGRGFDWRFPLIAALLAWGGAYVGNFVVALPTTSAELDAGILQVLAGLTWWSFETFFAEVITPVDHIYALFAAAVAAFYGRRRLGREEIYALRTMTRRGPSPR